MRNINKLLYLLPSKEKKKVIVLLVMVLIMAFLDMLGVASILPFMTVLTNPDMIETNFILNQSFKSVTILGIETKEQFLFFLGIVVIAILVISLIFKAITLYFQAHLVAMSKHKISRRLIKHYIHQPFSWVLNRNSAELGKTILSEVAVVISKGLQPALNLVTQGVLVIVLITMLTVVNAKLAFSIGLVFGLSYFLIYRLFRNLLLRLGEERLSANESRFMAVIEAFSGFKELKIGRLENIFIKRFSKHSKIFANHESTSIIIGMLPRFILEAIAFGGMLFIVLYFMKHSTNFNNILPIIVLYAFAGYRLMPAFQHIYSNFTQLRLVGPSIEKMYKDFSSLNPIVEYPNQDALPFNDAITLKNIYYKYPNSSKTTLKNINLTIPASSSVGFVGVTGSGKTTTADIILGLLEPQKGTLEIDKKIIERQNLKSWQKSIGYVPQNIFIADDTIAVNIAYGIDPKNIDQVAVENAAKIANLHDFITSELPLKYQTTIGEHGIRLSGGQRQRIGIARALYNNPKILVLDEATSSLDYITEKAVMEAVNNLNNSITTIIIAHRLSTVKKCDKIYLFEKGELKDHGPFEKLIKNNNLSSSNYS